KVVTPRACLSNGTRLTRRANLFTVFYCLLNMRPTGEEEVYHCVEVRWKNERKDFYRNNYKLPLSIADRVTNQAATGHGRGRVTPTGETVKVKIKKKNAFPDGEVLKI